MNQNTSEMGRLDFIKSREILNPIILNPEEKTMILNALAEKIDRLFKDVKSCKWYGDIPEAEGALSEMKEYEKLKEKIEAW